MQPKFWFYDYSFLAGSGLRINSVRQGKRPIVSDENRRNTYKQFQAAAALLEPSVLNTFDRERKLLMPVCIRLIYCKHFLLSAMLGVTIKVDQAHR